MTPTSDERREVAERMRNDASEFRRLGKEYDRVWTVDLGDVPAIFQDIAHYVGLDGTVRTDVLFDRVADFIDQTCEIDSVEPIEYGEFYETIGYVFHLTCGHAVMRPYMDMPPAYCDECGARVVDDD